ncbi:hypothetical protein [Gordonia iterans]|nr:hypothetical protein [Gordonia iterans]
MTNPFQNPFEPSPPRQPPNPASPFPPTGPPGLPVTPQYPVPGYPVYAPGQGYPAARQSRPPMPAPVVIASVLGLVAAAFIAAVAAYSGQGPFLWILVALAVVASVLLWLFPGNPTRIFMTALAGLWIFSWVGILIAVPVICLLWFPTSSRSYYEQLR